MSLLKPLCTGLFLCTTFLHVNAASRVETSDTTNQLLSKPIEGLNETQMDTFMLGKSFFRIPWVEAPSATTARDGLGPLFNANTCTSCHPHNGAGSVYGSDGSIARSLVTRLSVRHQKEAYKGLIPDAIYGSQLSINGVKDVPYEGKPTLRYEEKVEYYSDGTRVILQKPIIGVEDLKYGELSSHTAIVHRIAPALVGMGWIERIPEAAILALEDRDDKNGDGIRGKANRVYDIKTKSFTLGRFNWKASASTLTQQSASALREDMGITNPLFPDESCTPSQAECLNAPKGRDTLDATQERLDALAFYLSSLKVPRSTVKSKRGEQLFNEIGCVKCHVASFSLPSGERIAPYSDFLLHDMGEALADDGRVEFDAGSNEWRTQPLWSLGKRIQILGQKNFLHDGRARSIEEAVLWHDGEAKIVKEQFKALTKEQRKAVLSFVEEL